MAFFGINNKWFFYVCMNIIFYLFSILSKKDNLEKIKVLNF